LYPLFSIAIGYNFIITWVYTEVCVLSLLNQLRKNKTKLLTIARKRGASNVRVFGSVSREEETPDSDIDFLVSMEESRSLVDLVGLQQDLSVFLLRKVDVITDDGLNKYLYKKITNEALLL